MKSRLPSQFGTGDPAEAFEYHLALMREENKIPPDFKLSDNFRRNAILHLHKIWDDPLYTPNIITNLIFGLITGYWVGKTER